MSKTEQSYNNINIVLFGQMRAGKDTVAHYIKTKYKYMDFKFSHGITQIIEEYFPPAMQVVKPRELYQKIGQSLRELYADIWIDKTFKDIQEYKTINDHFPNMVRPIIITDGRQFNEAEACRNKGYIVVKVVADRDKRIERIKAERDNFNESMLDHETEQEVNRIKEDYTITNNGTLENLYKQIDSLMAEIAERGGTSE